MLQPALNTPVPNAPAPVATSSAATYGSLMTSAREALDHAIVVSNTRQPSAEIAHQELLGYERFLYTAGHHLRLLMTLGEVRTDATRRLASRLTWRKLREPSQGAWFDTAVIVGTAHDLVATHLAGGVPRTPEAKELLLGPGSAGACRNLAEMVVDAVDASRQLTHRATLAQKRRPDRPIPRKILDRIHTTNKVISVCARATLWDLTQLSPDLPDTNRGLEPAVPTDVTRSTTSLASSPLAALRLLRQMCHDQARGLTSASPASLRDLALLGTRINGPDLLGPAQDDRPLTRLQRAQAADQLDAARAAWTEASTELTTTVRGITKAPGPYGTAVQSLLTEPLNSRTRHALASALPSLGRDAARTVEALADRGDLVTLQPIPLQPRNAWRPITSEHSDAIAARFRNAADASSRAATAIHDLDRPRDEPQRAPGARQRALQAERARGVAR